MKFSKIFVPIAAASLSLVYSATVFLGQDMLLFKPKKQNPVGADVAPPQFKKVFAKTMDGLSLRANYFEGGADKPAILYNHGQSYNIDKLAFVMRPYIEAGFPVYMTEYRAYGGNPGKYSEAGFVLDIAAGWNFLRGEGHEKIIVHGFSMGCAHTARFAAEHKPQAVILESSFENLAQATRAATKLPLAANVLKYKMDTAGHAAKISAPTLVMHGSADKKVPIEQGRKVFQSVPHADKEFVEIPDSDHYIYTKGSIQKIITWLSSRGLDRC
ncbi:MAG: alpha/beta hydrolase [Rickettsiales bacterium]|jgi:pimeloyl-ACP methyl ester carboxylesterase|nr:alpha/beta hydrolase [Rickettsiales bacterium]